MRKRMTAALAIAAFATTAGTALADHGGEEVKHRLYRGMHAFGDAARIVEHLDRALELEDTQRQRIENIVSATQPEMAALRERAAANSEAMRDLDLGDDAYDTTLANLAREKGDIAAEMALLHGRMKAEIGDVLTPEQREKLAAGINRHHKGKHRRSRSR